MSHPNLYLGTHEPSWLRTSQVPLFVSHRRLARLRTTLPVAASPWALDSGGFSELSMYGGWRTSAVDYVTAVARYDAEIGRLDWAAPQDMMCEPDMLAKTGLTVADHQRATVASYVELAGLWAGLSDEECPFMPVLQGWDARDYLDCLARYADAGVDLTTVPLVGVGSVCRRQASSDIAEVFDTIAAADPDMPLHGFGVKTAGLRLYGDRLASCDSMSWSFNARKHPPMEGCSHSHCGNCSRWALRWRRRIVGPACRTHGEPCDARALATCR